MQFLKINEEQKKQLLSILGFEINEKGFLIYSETKQEHVCPVSHKKVSFRDASIMPGSLLVINSDPLTISEYLEEYAENRC